MRNDARKAAINPAAPVMWAALILAGGLLACNLPVTGGTLTQSGGPTPLPSVQATASPAPSATASGTPSPEPTSTATPDPTPYGCLRPPDDYSLVPLGGDMVLNQRTVSMLAQAQALYGGSHDLLGAVTQGSYNVGVEASFGTHDGGGAVDLSLRDLRDWNHILYEDMDAIILALRRAGFAAWVREPGDLYQDSPLHIHAIAIGDRDLSPAAQEQLTGLTGYFRGNDGRPNDPPTPDRHGGPLICPWMIEMGYSDLRGAP